MYLIILVFVFAFLEWFAEVRQNQRLIYVSKPAVMLLLIVWVWYLTGLPEAGVRWFVLGLVLCLAGDIFLMLPERFFMPGLVSFLLGHIAYLLAFGRLVPEQQEASAWILLIVAGLTWVGVLVYVRLRRGMRASGNERMRLPIAGYTTVISLMAYSALLRLFDPAWGLTPALWVSAGALFFLVSDILNAWSRFVGGIRNYRFKVMTTYHLAQIALAVGWVLHTGF
ncbi:MAG: lysoplasmalogenase [Anaerolineales bacterium]|nr:lysoplasmalogenase [Anaerolineales bacterium]